MTTPVAPVVPTAPTSLAPPTFSDAIGRIASKTGIAADPVVVTPTVELVRTPAPVDPPGSRDAPPGSVAPPVVEQVAKPGAASDGAAASPEAAPTGDGGELTLDDGTVIRVARNADGTFAKLDPSLKIDFSVESVVDKETGKPRAYSKSLPEVVRLAKDGVSLQHIVQTLKPEVEHYRENVPKWKQAHESLATAKTQAQTALAEMRALNVELLTAPDETVIARREQYAKEMSPEKQLERERADRARERATVEQQQQDQARQDAERQLDAQATAFIEARIAPAVTKAEAVLGVELVAGKMALATTPLLGRDGRIPRDRWPVLEAYVNGPFTEWVASETAKRTNAASDASAHAARERAAVEEAQRRAQSVVNDVGRNLVPIGRPGPDSAPTLPKATTVQGVVERMIHRPLPATVGASG